MLKEQRMSEGDFRSRAEEVKKRLVTLKDGL